MNRPIFKPIAGIPIPAPGLQRFIVQETIIREYELAAFDIDDAIAKGMYLDEKHPFSETSYGLTYVKNMETDEDRIL